MQLSVFEADQTWVGFWDRLGFDIYFYDKTPSPGPPCGDGDAAAGHTLTSARGGMEIVPPLFCFDRPDARRQKADINDSDTHRRETQ